jgi:hypothetical protein
MFLIRYENMIINNDENGSPIYITRMYYKMSNEKTENEIYQTKKFLYSIIEENETVEVINKMIENDLKNIMWPDEIRFSYNYNSTTGYLDIKCSKPFQITSDVNHLNIFNQRDVIELLKFFNQEVTTRTYLDILSPTINKTFDDNV